MSELLLREQYRGRLNREDAAETLAALSERAEALVRQGRLMTAAMYRYGRQLFLYMEAIGEPFDQETLAAGFEDDLAAWPEKEETRHWAKMYPVFWHQEPLNAEDWRRKTRPQARRGRIAYLRGESLFEYVYHHYALTREGLHRGDRYMFISLHEDVLFSYFEEPRTADNIRRTVEGESAALKDWLAVDPDSHFIHLPGSGGRNFLLLPEVFAFGQDG
ncbi:MAG: hypothetical protein IKP40_07520 [Clostridia bacterium]|nr:hypothetical protein [Clostridia bacterium]